VCDEKSIARYAEAADGQEDEQLGKLGIQRLGRAASVLICSRVEPFKLQEIRMIGLVAWNLNALDPGDGLAIRFRSAIQPTILLS
jgi:hypothetical protein